MLDVVVPSFNTREITLRCLRSLLATEVPLRCVVVDNASTDGTADAVAREFPQVALIRSEMNLGYAGAANRGAAAGQGDLLLLLNADVFARQDALGRLTGFLREHPRDVAAVGRLVDVGTDEPQIGFAVRSFPTFAQQAALLTGLERFWPANPISRRARMPDFDYGRTQDLEAQPAGACLLVRRTDFEAVGGFDEAFFFWFEDVDLLLRLRERGPLAYVHDAVFEHVGGASWSLWDRPQVIGSRYRSLLRYFAKHRPAHEQAMLRALVGFLGMIRALGWLPRSPARSRAYAEVVRLAIRGA